MLIYNTIYKKNILHSINTPFIVKFLMTIEAIPLILVLDDIIFKRSFNSLLFIFYVLSPVTWYKYISYLILNQNSTISNVTCQKENPDILQFNYLRYVEAFDYNGIIYDGSYIIILYLLVYLILCILMQTLPIKQSFAFKDKLFIKLAYLLHRYCSILFFIPANDQLFTFIYNYLYHGLFTNFLIILSNCLLQIGLIISVMLFLRNTTCIYRLFPNDFESIYYEIILFVLKVFCSVIYGFNKVCSMKTNLFAFCCLIYVLMILILVSITICKYRKLYLSNPKYNSFRLLICLFSFGLIVFKLIETLLNLTETIQTTILFILCLIGIFIGYTYIHKFIDNKLFTAKEYYSIDLFYYSRKYLEILEQNSVIKQKIIYDYYFDLAQRLSIHRQTCKEEECLVCNNINVNDISGNNFHTFLEDYFNFHLKKKEIKDDLYYDMLRVNCYIIKTNKLIITKNQSVNNSYRFVFDLFKHHYKTGQNRQINLVWNFYLQILFIDEQQKINRFKNNILLKEQVMVENFYFLFEFETVLNKLNELIHLMKDNFDTNIIVDKANQIYNSKKLLQNYFSKTTLDKDSYFNFSVNFNYKYIFNKNICKNIFFDDNQELINFYEENYEKSRYFILEYVQKDRNLLIRTVPEALIKDIYYSLEELKNKRMSVLFPRFALEQLDGIITQIEANNKEVFQCKLMMIDGKGYIKYLLFNFKTLIDKNMRIFLITNYAAPKVDDKNKNNLFIITEKGELVLYSESFAKFIISDRETNNFFDIIKIKKEHILNLPYMKNNKYLDIEAQELFIDGVCSYELNAPLRLTFHNTLFHNERQCHFFEIRKITKLHGRTFQSMLLRTEDTNHPEEEQYDDDESTFKFTNSMRYTTSTVISDSTKKTLNDDHLLPGIVRQNIDSFKHLFDKRPLIRLEYFIYILNSILIIVGIIFLVYFDRMLNNFNTTYNSLYNIKQLQLNIYRQMACYTNDLIFPGGKAYHSKNRKLWFEVVNTVTIQQFRNKLIGDGIRGLKTYLSSIETDSDFYAKFNTDLINYLEIDTQKREFVIKQNTFINIVDLLYIHINEISDIEVFVTNLDISELETPSKELSSILFITHNFFSFFSVFYKEVDTFMFETVNNQYNTIQNTVIDYYIIFIVSHVSIVLLLIYYLIMINGRYSIVFRFMYNFDKNHLKHLEKKFSNLIKSVNSIITPSTLIHSLKEHSDLKKKGEHDKDNDKRKDLIKLMEVSNSIKSNICNLVFSRFLAPLSIILTVYVVYFVSSLLGFTKTFKDINVFSQYISHYFGFQTGIYESYLLTRFAYISNLNLKDPLTQLKTEQDFVDYYEQLYLGYMMHYETMLVYTYNYDIFDKLNNNIQMTVGEELCELIYIPEDPLLSQFVSPTPHDVVNILKSECKTRMKADEDIMFSIIDMAGSLRTIIDRLKTHVYPRETITRDGLFSSPIDIITTIRYYFVYIYRTYNTPILTDRLKLTYNVCIILFVLCVALDLACLIINKMLILNRALNGNKVMLNLLNIIKK
jgi:hypothetical protein